MFKLGYVHQSINGQAKNRLGAVNAVAACQCYTRFGTNGPGTFQYLLRHFGRQLINGPAQYGNGQYGFAAHGIHIANGVGTGNAPKIVGIIHNGHKKVGGGN